MCQSILSGLHLTAGSDLQKIMSFIVLEIYFMIHDRVTLQYRAYCLNNTVRPTVVPTGVAPSPTPHSGILTESI